MDWTITVLRSRLGEEIFDARRRRRRLRGAADGRVRDLDEEFCCAWPASSGSGCPTPPGRTDGFVRPSGLLNPH
jgi:hypothetical protein